MSSTSFTWGKNLDLSGIPTRDLWVSSRQCYQLSHWGRQDNKQPLVISSNVSNWMKTIEVFWPFSLHKFSGRNKRILVEYLLGIKQNVLDLANSSYEKIPPWPKILEILIFIDYLNLVLVKLTDHNFACEIQTRDIWIKASKVLNQWISSSEIYFWPQITLVNNKIKFLRGKSPKPERS
jgi:hypothetical protein